MNLVTTSTIFLLFVSGCQKVEISNELPDDPYLKLIEDASEKANMPTGFSDKFKKQYLESVNAELKRFDYDLRDPESLAKIHNLRAGTYYNLWGTYGIDYFDIPRASDFALLKNKMARMQNTLLEKEIEINELKRRIATTEKKSALNLKPRDPFGEGGSGNPFEEVGHPWSYRMLKKSLQTATVSILGWRTLNSKKPENAVIEILIRMTEGKKEGWLPVEKGNQFSGLRFERLDLRADVIGDPDVAIAGVITEDISLSITSGNPSAYVILRSFGGGDSFAFFSNIPHPKLSEMPSIYELPANKNSDRQHDK
ncbi:MAG: hypothetical protein L3J39_05710 [Verrucomicrobiales bacterium]|nr:hypothetical protein [Verrucomicrobiales bacterium]